MAKIMTHFTISAILLMFAANCSAITSVLVNTEQQGHAGMPLLLSQVINVHYPSCNIILISDSYFQKFLLSWMPTLSRPVYTINLEDAPSYLKAVRYRIGEDVIGTKCSVMILCCRKRSSCRTRYTGPLYEFLINRKILRRERYAFLYLKGEITNTFQPPPLFDKKTNTSSPVLLWAASLLKELKCHITVIRRINDTFSDGSPNYQLATFTKNWLPGGSPVLNAIWSMKRQGFLRGGEIKMTLKNLRRNGLIRVALPSEQLLPTVEMDKAGKAKGIDAELLQIMAQRFNITVKYFEVEDQQFGKKLKSGNWTGVIRQVFDKHGDIGLGHIVQTFDRVEAGVHFTKTIQMLRGAVICPLPAFLPRWQDIYAPFKKWIWASFAASALLALTFSTFAQRMVRYYFVPKSARLPKTFVVRRRPRASTTTKWFPWIHFLGPLLQKSIPLSLLPSHHGFRLLFVFWALFGFLLSVLYGSLLVGRMSIPEKEPPFDTVRELVERSANWSLSGLIIQTMQNATYWVEHKLYNSSFDVNTDGAGGNELKEFKYAVQTGKCAVTERSRAKYVIDRNYTIVHGSQRQRLLRWSKEAFLVGPSSWVLRPDVDFLFRAYIDRMSGRLNSHGVLAKITDIYAPERKQLQKEEDGNTSDLKPLGLESLQMVFFIWMGGIFISGVAFTLELSAFGSRHVKQMKEVQRIMRP